MCKMLKKSSDTDYSEITKAVGIYGRNKLKSDTFMFWSCKDLEKFNFCRLNLFCATSNFSISTLESIQFVLTFLAGMLIQLRYDLWLGQGALFLGENIYST